MYKEFILVKEKPFLYSFLMDVSNLLREWVYLFPSRVFA